MDARRVPGFLRSLERRRPRHSYPHHCQVRIRQAEIIVQVERHVADFQSLKELRGRGFLPQVKWSITMMFRRSRRFGTEFWTALRPRLKNHFNELLKFLLAVHRHFSYVTTCGTLAAKMKSSGVFSYQPF